MTNNVQQEAAPTKQAHIPNARTPLIFISRLRLPTYPRHADGACPGFLCLADPHTPAQRRDAVLVTFDDEIYGFARVIDAGHRSHVKWSKTLVGQYVNIDFTIAQKRGQLQEAEQALLMHELARIDELLEGGRRYLDSYETPFGAQVIDRQLGLRLLKAAYAQAAPGAAGTSSKS